MCNYSSYNYDYNIQSQLIFHTCVASHCNTVLRHTAAAVHMPNNFTLTILF